MWNLSLKISFHKPFPWKVNSCFRFDNEQNGHNEWTGVWRGRYKLEQACCWFGRLWALWGLCWGEPVVSNKVLNTTLQGDLEKLRDSSNVFLTIHDIGSSYLQWVHFTKHEDMMAIRARYAALALGHICCWVTYTALQVFVYPFVSLWPSSGWRRS